VTSEHDIEGFYRRMAAKLDAIRSELPNDTPIDDKFAAFLTTAAREFRDDAESMARKLIGKRCAAGQCTLADSHGKFQ
jgi:hypothetical protein